MKMSNRMLRNLKKNIEKKIVVQETLVTYLIPGKHDMTKRYHQGCLDTLKVILEDMNTLGAYS